jgi:hypothetical protein
MFLSACMQVVWRGPGGGAPRVHCHVSLLASFSCLALSLFLGLAVFTPTYPAFFLVQVNGVGNVLSLSHYDICYRYYCGRQ